MNKIPIYEPMQETHMDADRQMLYETLYAPRRFLKPSVRHALYFIGGFIGGFLIVEAVKLLFFHRW
jgi:hypothetical protein